MGRRKIEIQPIADERNRSVTFSKRKAGLFKKAHELAILCKVDVALIIIGQNNKIYKYSSDSTETILNKFNVSNIEEDKSPDFYGDYQTQSRIGNSIAPQSHSQSRGTSQTSGQEHSGLSGSINNSIVTQLHNDGDHQGHSQLGGQLGGQFVGKRLREAAEANDPNKRTKYLSEHPDQQPTTPPATTSNSTATLADPKLTPFSQNNYLKRHTRSHSKNRPALSLQIPDKDDNSKRSKPGPNLPIVTPTTQYINNIVNQTELPSALSGYFNLNISPVQTSSSSNSFMFPQQGQPDASADVVDNKSHPPQAHQLQFQQPPVYHPMNSASSIYFPKKMTTPGVGGPLSSLQVPQGMYNSQTPTLSAFKDIQSPSGYFNQDNWPSFPVQGQINPSGRLKQDTSSSPMQPNQQQHPPSS